VSPGIVISLIALAILLVAGYVWYRRSIAGMRPTDPKPVSGVRLTAEALHRAPAPWRVVHEVGGALGDIDHVIVGPVGVVAVTTVVGDRPDPRALLDARAEALLIIEAAVARGPLDELLRAADTSCQHWARVYWGTPDARRPAVEQLVHGSALVEGQRIGEWLDALATSTSAHVDPPRVDLVWRTIVTGIGRPDPLQH
jgi:hypothetical protein